MMDLKKCAFCNNSLSGKNRTKEHVIPNAIGGRKKTTEFICNTCNNKLGEKWDSELARQLNWFSLTTGISRERGEPPKQLVSTLDGSKYWLMTGGSFTIERSSYFEEQYGDKIKISVTVKNFDEAKKCLKGISRKYPQVDVEGILKNLDVKTDYMDSPVCVNLYLRGHEVGRSLVKTAFAFSSICGVAHNECDKARQYLLDEHTKTIPYGFAYLSDFIQSRPKEKVFHCVSLHGDPKSRLLWSYIEYFGFFRIVVLLSENYTGEPKNEIYSIDPVDGNPAGVKIRQDIDREELLLIVSGNGINNNYYAEAAQNALSIIMEIGRRRAFDSVFKDAFDYAAKHLGIKEGDIIPKESAAKFSELMMYKIVPYIEYIMRSGGQRLDC